MTIRAFLQSTLTEPGRSAGDITRLLNDKFPPVNGRLPRTKMAVSAMLCNLVSDGMLRAVPIVGQRYRFLYAAVKVIPIPAQPVAAAVAPAPVPELAPTDTRDEDARDEIILDLIDDNAALSKRVSQLETTVARLESTVTKLAQLEPTVNYHSPKSVASLAAQAPKKLRVAVVGTPNPRETIRIAQHFSDTIEITHLDADTDPRNLIAVSYDFVVLRRCVSHKVSTGIVGQIGKRRVVFCFGGASSTIVALKQLLSNSSAGAAT